MNDKDVRVIRTWRNTPDQSTVIFSLPHEICKRYDISAPTNLLLIPREDGILLKKLFTGDTK